MLLNPIYKKPIVCEFVGSQKCVDYLQNLIDSKGLNKITSISASSSGISILSPYFDPIFIENNSIVFVLDKEFNYVDKKDVEDFLSLFQIVSDKKRIPKIKNKTKESFVCPECGFIQTTEFTSCPSCGSTESRCIEKETSFNSINRKIKNERKM